MKCRLPFVVGLAALLSLLAVTEPAFGQCPPQTNVVDTLFNADGSPAEGRVVIAWPTFQAGNCQVVSGQISVTVTAGALSVPLYPNDASTPAGTSYRVTYYLKSGRITTEYWVVPVSGSSVSLAIVRSPSVPAPAVMVSQAQVTNLVADLSGKLELPLSCPAGKFLQANGSVTPPQVACVDGTGAPLASSSQSGTVKTDVDAADPLVYTKSTADTLLAGKAPTTHTHTASQTTSGVFDPSRLPAPTSSTLGGVQSGTCSGTDKLNGISTAGGLLFGTDQVGSGGGGSQHQVNSTDLISNSTINFEDTATISFSNPSAGSVQATLQDSSVSSAKLAVAGPSSAQLSGLDDDNIAAGALSPNRIAGTAEITASKGAANGYAALNSSTLVVQNPANAQATPAASKIPIADGAGKLDDGWLSANVSLLGSSISLASEVTGTLPLTNVDPIPAVFVVLNNSASSLSPADGATHFIGMASPAFTADTAYQQLWIIPLASTVTTLRVQTNCGTAGSGESITFTLRKNAADTAITGTGTWNAADTTQSFTGSVAYAAGDKLSVKMVFPSFATNPATCRPIVTITGTIP